jgi:C4-type Zn-finger protein
MYTAITTLILFLIAIFAVLLFFKSKKDRQATLDDGECPTCGATTKTFKDETTNTTFKVSPIKTRILKNHGCSGVVEIEYVCESCGLKEVHNSVGQGCRF